MALVSPGVEVTIIDQSQYLPAASNSVPLIILATAQSKANAAGTAVAPGTIKANAGKLYQMTSQRDLTTTFGNPFFYKTTNGTPIHGYELNEYGMLATYSLLGLTNRCYILRADIDLAELVGSVSRPSGEPIDGTYWLDTTNSSWGIYEFNSSTGKFVSQTPTVLTSSDQLTGGNIPLSTIGNVGDYAIVSISTAPATYFYKTLDNIWVKLGGWQWSSSVPTIVGSYANPTLTQNDTFTINHAGEGSRTITVPVNNTVDGIVTAITNLNIGNLKAKNINGNLNIYSSYPDEVSQNTTIEIVAGTGTVLDDLGISAGVYYSPDVVYGTSAQMPLWTKSQAKPHPTGSVWIKTSSAGSGLNLSLSKYSSATASWISTPVSIYNSTLNATADLDSTGGTVIPANTVISKYCFNENYVEAPIRFYSRIATGHTVFTSPVSNPTLFSGVKVNVYVSGPGSTSTTGIPNLSRTFTTTGTTLASFVSDWQLAQIPYTTAIVTTDGALQLTHTLGGEILIDATNVSGINVLSPNQTLLSALGFFDAVSGTAGDMTVNTKGPFVPYQNIAANPSATSGTGTGGSFNIKNIGGYYQIISASGGSGYAVGDEITISYSELGGISSDNTLKVTVNAVSGGSLSKVSFKNSIAGASMHYMVQVSNWKLISYTPNEGALVQNPANGTYWFYSTPTQVDIMVNKGGVWKGYRNVNFDSNGHPSNSGSNSTDPAGPIVAASAPTTQSDGTSLVYGDLWIDSADLENYPMLYRWQSVNSVDQWVLIDKTDQTSSNGLLFADARWSASGAVDPVNDPIPTIVSLLTSNHLDLDAPDPALYPQGMLLFNTRRSGYNVKEFTTDYFTNKNYPNAGIYNAGAPTNNANLPEMSYTWVSASGLKADGSAYMGRKAQRELIVKAMKSAIDTNQTIREEDNFFNLISAPGYPELQPNMVTLNNDRHNTAYIVGDTPLRLEDNATAITAWANNTTMATETGEDGWVTRDSYLGVFYPSGITTDLTGTAAVVPASHMMLRTFLRNDTVAYPWLAPAGTRRGTIDNATNIGYLDAMTGEFQVVKNRNSIRDVLYTNQINPLAYFTGIGLLNYGNKNSKDTQSALDRINVARLVCYIRDRLQVAARPFVFEPNDALTRNQLTGVVQSLFIDLVAKRGLYDYLVVCDASNNTTARIDRNELWIDIAIEPVKAAEFIYIPVRVMNTGALAAGG
jgi:hypothetical protein